MKKFLNNLYTFILNLQFIFKPSYWIMNEKYDKYIDELMNHLIDTYDFTEISDCRAKLGKIEIWIESRPYSCMMPYDKSFKYRPSRLTIQKGIRKLKKQMRENTKAKVISFIEANK